MAESYGIKLRHPVQGDLLGHTLTLAAIGTAFEATYGWRLLAGGSVLAEGHFQAGSMGTMEAFVHQEGVSVTHLGPATFQLFGDDPSGEHPPGVDLVEVPVILIPGMTGYRIHTVVRGDTLSKLARDYGSAVDTIATANSIANPDLIRVGQVLRIPV